MMKKRLYMEEDAQSALFDGIIFFIIMIVLSSVMFAFTTMSSQSVEAYTRGEMTSYAEESFFASMSATVPDAYYEDINGDHINRSQGNAMIKYLLLEELGLLDDGVPQNHFTGFKQPINETIRRLVSAQYHFALISTYNNASSGQSYVIINSDVATSTSSIPRIETVSFSWSQPMLHPAKYGKASIEFVIWRMD